MRGLERPFGVSLLGQHLHGIAVDIAVAAVFGIILALLVLLAGRAMVPLPEDLPARSSIPPIVDVDPWDLDPRDPLVLCTVFVDRVSCAREES